MGVLKGLGRVLQGIFRVKTLRKELLERELNLLNYLTKYESVKHLRVSSTQERGFIV